MRVYTSTLGKAGLSPVPRGVQERVTAALLGQANRRRAKGSSVEREVADASTGASGSQSRDDAGSVTGAGSRLAPVQEVEEEDSSTESIDPSSVTIVI